jgi:hypothetical protein
MSDFDENRPDIGLMDYSLTDLDIYAAKKIH